MSNSLTRSVCAALVAGVFGAVASAPALAADEATSRVIVKFKSGAFSKGKLALAAQGGRVLTDLSEVNAVATKLSPKAIAALKLSKHVEFVEDDHVQTMFGQVKPSANNSGETVPYGITQSQSDQVSDSAAGNRKLCIIDSGIDINHPDLAGLTLTGQNFTTSGEWFTDESAHGTHVAGTIAARGGNRIGVVGVLPNATMPIHIAKVFDASGSTSSSTVAKAMLACGKAGANVVSMSLGGSGASRVQQFVARLLAGRGVLMIAAAGNAGTTAISYPAGFTEVMSVGALDANKAWASFSQYNADVEISAAGVGVESTVPVGSASESITTVGSATYASIPVEGTPGAIVTAPLYNFGLGLATDAGAAGKVCLIQRGSISFADKVLACQNSGGVGAIIYNNTAGPLSATLGGVVTTIPSTGVSDVDGAAMLGQIGQSATVDTVTLTPNDYAAFNGTSMATPHVAAIAALVWSQHPTCTAEQIRSTLKNSAMDLGTVGRDDKFGAGLVQAKAATDRITAMGCAN